RWRGRRPARCSDRQEMRSSLAFHGSEVGCRQPGAQACAAAADGIEPEFAAERRYALAHAGQPEAAAGSRRGGAPAPPLVGENKLQPDIMAAVQAPQRDLHARGGSVAGDVGQSFLDDAQDGLDEVLADWRGAGSERAVQRDVGKVLLPDLEITPQRLVSAE